MKPFCILTIPGRPIVKKNTQRTYGSGRSTRRVSSPRYTSWALNARAACNRQFKGALVDCLVTASFRFYFKDRSGEADVSNLVEGPQDILVESQIISDDKLVRKIVAEKFFGHEPRTEIELFKYEASDAPKIVPYSKVENISKSHGGNE